MPNPETTTYRGLDGKMYYRSTDPFVDGQAVGEITPPPMPNPDTMAIRYALDKAMSSGVSDAGDVDIPLAIIVFLRAVRLTEMANAVEEINDAPATRTTTLAPRPG